MSMKSLPALAWIFFLAIGSFAQATFDGKVTAIVDGRTISVEVAQNKAVQVELNCIEVPEPEQQLAETVKEHLAVLVLNKTVKVRQLRNFVDFIVAEVYLGEINISLQMLRDGAAWKYGCAEEDYGVVEEAAKKEKRGIWGIPDLKPAWVFRAERDVDLSSNTEERLTSADPSENVHRPGTRVKVKGYVKKDGTYVRPHTRSLPSKKP
jgi:micrococcal nuclease